MSIVIRNVTEDDAKALLQIYSYYVENTAITFEYDVPGVEEFQNRIRTITKRYPYLALEEDGKILGYAYAGTFKPRAAYDWSVETTIYIDKNCKRNGYGKLLYERLEEELKKIDIKNMYACIAYPVTEDAYLTKDSRQFHEHLGFQLVGEFHQCGRKFDRWYNMIWMEKMIGEHI